MTHTEFVQRTGYYPTDEQFEKINVAYMSGNEDKDMFCREWVAYDGILKASKEAAAKISTLESKLQKVYDTLDEYIFKHNDTLDTLDDKSDRRAYFYELFKEIKAIKWLNVSRAAKQE